MTILNFFKSAAARRSAAVPAFLSGYSIEVMPKTAAEIDDLRTILPAGTRVYITHIKGTPEDDMVACARRLTDEGFTPMPHVPAATLDSREALETRLRRYAEEAGARQALVLSGDRLHEGGAFESSMAMLETGLFDKHGFNRLHVAGHPEGNRDIDPDGGTSGIDAAARWKQDFSERTEAEMGLVTQFVFAAEPVIDWAERMRQSGVTLPIHVGVAGPAKLQTLLKYAIACGVGPSLSVLQKRAKDVTRLVKPFEPTEVLSDLADYCADNPETQIAGAHIFPLGGLHAATDYANRMSRSRPAAESD
ncbi:methylenetetrahydrofolate reductase [Roseivivax sediminis]|uniref:Methylenetetrahydrofolate reductase (NADPH) n=1 Tax=Roseivivax sediminis TaxID=936889 RepID=A0A1I2D3Q0_9RHOB|nr:methylenetetrahydrofolate reductase [Roseivivax sediminis]SFE75124.1 methylenetetrahydrofolate reductase (NADPH) [Roseivivax sediminis]